MKESKFFSKINPFKMGKGKPAQTLTAAGPADKSKEAEKLIKRHSGLISQSVLHDQGDTVLFEVRSYDSKVLNKLMKELEDLGFEAMFA